MNYDMKPLERFFKKLRRIEKRYDLFSLNPSTRYWIDTYPPANTLIDDDNPSDYWSEIAKTSADHLYFLYFHLGFCRSKCAFCRQYEICIVNRPSASRLLVDYLSCLERDLTTLVEILSLLPVNTKGLYFGGGTPSLLTERQLATLFESITRSIQLDTLEESSTLEMSPEDVCRGKIKLISEMRIPRLSLGLQSTDDAILRSIGRRHTHARAIRGLELISEFRSFSVNVDIIMGFKQHSDFDTWVREIESLSLLLKSGLIDSVTLYPLHYFPGTKLKPDRDAIFWQIRNLVYARDYLINKIGLTEAPIHFYGKKTSEPFNVFGETYNILGLGNSSFSKAGNWLLVNERDIDRYLSHDRESGLHSRIPVEMSYRLSRRQRLIASMLFALHNGAFKMTPEQKPALGSEINGWIDRYLEDGLIIREQNVYRLTDTGKIFAHQIPINLFDSEIKKRFTHIISKRFS